MKIKTQYKLTQKQSRRSNLQYYFSEEDLKLQQLNNCYVAKHRTLFSALKLSSFIAMVENYF